MVRKMASAETMMAQADADDETDRRHVCKVCSRSFKRREHCIRHVRGHTQEKPFSCRYCRRTYSRKDLVVRHERTLHPKEHTAMENTGLLPSESTDALPSHHPISVPDDNDNLDNDDIDTICVATSDRQDHTYQLTRSPDLRPSKLQKTSKAPARLPTPPLDPLLPISNNLSSDFLNHTRSPQLPSTGMYLESAQSFPIHGASGPQSDHGHESFLEQNLPDLDFFDPFFGSTLEQFSLPNLPENFENFSPLEPMSLPSQQNSPENIVSGQQSTPVSARNIPEHPLNTTTTQASVESVLTSTTSRMPQVMNVPTAKIPPLLFTEPMRANMIADYRLRLKMCSNVPVSLPSAGALQKCVRTYMEVFHIHLPLLHVQSLDLMHTPSPLVLAMAAIGALYRLERRIAAELYGKAVCVLNGPELDVLDLLSAEQIGHGWTKPQANDQSDVRPLWVGQTRLLTAWFAAFSGQPALVRKSIEEFGYLANEYRTRLSGVKVGSSDKQYLQWSAWVERESVKRLLYSILIFSNLLSITYGLPPGFYLNQDGIIEMPDDELLWHASTALQWHNIVNRNSHSVSISLRDAMSVLMNGSPREENSRSLNTDTTHDLSESYWNWSPFATSLIMHSISTLIWHTMHGTDLWTHDNGSDSPTNREEIARANETALNRCRELLIQARSGWEHLWTEAEGPLLFNAYAVLRVCYGRAFTGIRLADRTLLLKDNLHEIMLAIQEYVQLPQERNEFTAKAISRSLEGMALPFRSGAPLIRKTAALTWSIEHALAGWDTVTKWVHTVEILLRSNVEIDAAEKIVFDEVETFLRETETPVSHQRSRAADLARLWASFYDDTWTWGVTPRIGWFLRELANEYESAWRATTDQRLIDDYLNSSRP